MNNRMLLCALSFAVMSVPADAAPTPAKQPVKVAQKKVAQQVQRVVAPMIFPLAYYSTPIVRAKPPVTEAEKAAAKGRPCPAPEYPYGAMKRNEQGTASIQFLVEPDGWVSDARIMKSSGHAELDEAALSTIGGCWFEPARHGLSEWAETSFTWKL